MNQRRFQDRKLNSCQTCGTHKKLGVEFDNEAIMATKDTAVVRISWKARIESDATLGALEEAKRAAQIAFQKAIEENDFFCDILDSDAISTIPKRVK